MTSLQKPFQRLLRVWKLGMALGPLINDAAVHKVESFVQDAISKVIIKQAGLKLQENVLILTLNLSFSFCVS
ncbi:hypothetical protein ACS0TY_006954 [Phlomoides rotata]